MTAKTWFDTIKDMFDTVSFILSFFGCCWYCWVSLEVPQEPSINSWRWCQWGLLSLYASYVECRHCSDLGQLAETGSLCNEPKQCHILLISHSSQEHYVGKDLKALQDLGGTEFRDWLRVSAMGMYWIFDHLNTTLLTPSEGQYYISENKQARHSLQVCTWASALTARQVTKLTLHPHPQSGDVRPEVTNTDFLSQTSSMTLTRIWNLLAPHSRR